MPELPTSPDESPQNRLKRLRIRCWRRGTKEMDLVLGPFADAELAGLSKDALTDMEALLDQNDQDIYRWFSHQMPSPQAYEAFIARLRAFHNLPIQ